MCVKKKFLQDYIILLYSLIIINKRTIVEWLNKIVARVVVPREIIIHKSLRSIIKRNHLYEISVPSNYLHTYYSNRKHKSYL